MFTSVAEMASWHTGKVSLLTRSSIATQSYDKIVRRKQEPLFVTSAPADGIALDSAGSADVRADQLSADLLPPWTYQSEEFFKLETEHLFKPNWLLVGHISDLPNAGDYLTFDAFSEQVIVLRDTTGQLNAFHNVCQHRAARLLEGRSGNCHRAMMCPFHGWSYTLDGKLNGVPAAQTFANLDKDSIALKSVDMEVWLGFVFIRFGTGESLRSQLGAMEHEVTPYRPEELQPLKPATDELVPSNWKIIHDVDNEGYHVPVGHPSLYQLYGQNYEDTLENGFLVSRGTVQEKPARAWSVKRYQSLLPHFDHLPDERQRLWFYFQHFPNLVFGFYPDMMEVYMTIPVSPDSTRYVSRTYALPDSRSETRAARYLNLRINAETAEEDDTFVGYLQAGLKSSAWTPPHLSSLEEGVRTFHHRIQSHLPVGRLVQAPDEAQVSQINKKLRVNAQSSR